MVAGERNVVALKNNCYPRRVCVWEFGGIPLLLIVSFNA